MVLPDSDGISRAPSYSGSTQREYIFNYRIITFFDSTFQMIRLIYSFVTPYRVSYNPNKQAYWFGLFRFARRYSGNRFSFSSSGY